MLLVVLGGMALVFGVPLLLVVAAFVVSSLPAAAALAVVLVASGAVVVRKKLNEGVGAPDEGALLRQLSGRVATGATIRSAIADPSIRSVPNFARRLAALGRPMSEVGLAFGESLPVNGQSFRAVCSFSEHTGAAIASALSVLAERSDETEELARHRRVSLAQVKLSAVVVGVVPIVASIVLVAVGGIPDPGGAVIVVPMATGLLLQAIGTFVVFRVASGST